MKKNILLSMTLFFLSCMDPRPNYDECVDIETARCNVREQCRSNEDFDDEYPDFDVDACIRYGKEHCRTRKIAGEDWVQRDVEDCVTAILSLKSTCDQLFPRGVDETESIGQCNFLDNTDAGLLVLPEINTETPEEPDGGKNDDTDETSPLKDAGA